MNDFVKCYHHIIVEKIQVTCGHGHRADVIIHTTEIGANHSGGCINVAPTCVSEVGRCGIIRPNDVKMQVRVSDTS